MLNIKITWPAALLILAALVVWLIRQGSAGAQPQPAHRPRPSARPERQPRQPVRPQRTAEPENVIIIDQHRDGQDERETVDLDTVTYEEAVRLGTYSPEQLDAIADRELRDVVRNGMEANRDPHLDAVIDQFKSRSYARR